MLKPWLIATDFDGTLTVQDIGNELCLELIRDKFTTLHALYRKNELDLKDMQRQLWSNFPAAEAQFRQLARRFGQLRPGVEEFFVHCATHDIPIYVVSCGLRPYIEEVLHAHLSPTALGAIKGIVCNEVRFDAVGICEFLPPETDPASPYPLDKGAWIFKVRHQFYKNHQILGIGNGTSDRSFVGHVDRLAATEALSTWCQKNAVEHIYFEDFRDLQKQFFV